MASDSQPVSVGRIPRYRMQMSEGSLLLFVAVDTQSGDLLDPRDREWVKAEDLARVEAQRGWKPIESAPKDGTVIDVWLGKADEDDLSFYCVAGSRRSANWAWREGRFRPVMGLHLPIVTVFPTHWIEIPADPPTNAERQET